MLIIGVDFHPQFQQIVWVDTDTGELQEQRLQHREEAETFYRALAAAGQKVRVGMEASGHARWSERLLAELQFELWMGDATQIQSKRGRKQKTACLSETAPVCPSSSTWRSGGSTPVLTQPRNARHSHAQRYSLDYREFGWRARLLLLARFTCRWADLASRSRQRLIGPSVALLPNSRFMRTCVLATLRLSVRLFRAF